ncbi:M43 family zinc metalloprotease [Arthrobacter sp. U41]|uniref:M43 family zinc metalloprotease n=1 Tax=Arthrobacter sp. U41 TaxID=1849032 RepID=UPI0008593C8F|nr:M43 family zinc metalloprotease [Arthrobacter sp. U41]AOT05151.1 hypothetical protein ASPU41_19365 [Arthrobacter sp. U41]
MLDTGIAAEAFSLARQGDIKVSLMTVQLSDKSEAETNAISLVSANTAIQVASNYWKTMSNNRLSFSVSNTRTGVKSSAASWQSYTQIMETVTREIGWVSNPYTALVVFVASPTLSSGAYGAGWSTNGISGRVLMPLPGTLTNSVVTHEFGHLLGLMHADSLQCGSGATDVASLSDGTFADPSCSIREYGDTMDLMGASQTSQPAISSSLWQFAGFGRGDEIFDAGTVGDRRSFTLTAWAGTAPNRAVKFRDPVSQEVYYLELRLPVGYDTATAVGGNRGVKIVQNGGSTSASSIILMPNAKPFAGYYSYQHAWQAGQIFTTHAGTKVSIDWISSSAAGVTIESTFAAASKAIAAVGSSWAALGASTSGVVCGLRDGGCYQDYEGGAVIWSPATGAQPTWGAIRARWGSLNFVDGPMGYPTSAEVCGLPQGGCYQDYQGGAIIWSPATGAQPTSGAIRARWAALNFVDGPLGYPASGVTCGQPGGGCYQDYQGGAIIWSAGTGAHASTGPIRTAWGATGFIGGSMGYPTAEVTCGLPQAGCYQDYQGGAIIWSQATGARATSGEVRARWAALHFVDGPLGYPTGDMTCGQPGGGCYQDYQGGAIVWSPATGAHASAGPIRTAWGATGFLSGPMGYPTGGVTCGLPEDGCYQDYQGGAIISSPGTGTRVSTGPIRTRWAALNFVDGPLGYPTGEVTCGQPGGGCYQNYQRGVISWSTGTGAHASTGPIRTAWDGTGFLSGPLGYATGEVTCGLPEGGCYQDYQGGAIIWSPGTGARLSIGPIRTAWAATGFLTGPLGYPIGDVTCGLPQGGCYQDYQGGAIISSPGTGTRVSTGPIRTRWAALNFVDGPLGYPTGDVTCGQPGGGCYQDYQGGAVCDRLSVGRFSQEFEPCWWLVSGQKSGKN